MKLLRLLRINIWSFWWLPQWLIATVCDNLDSDL